MKRGDLRRLRKRLRLSQAAFSDLIGVTPNTVARWERGELGMRTTTERLIELLVAREDARIKRKRKGGK